MPWWRRCWSIGAAQPDDSVLLLIVSFGALAGLYVLLDAPFVAVTQIIVYAGAIMVLFLFVVMLLNAPHGRPSRPGACAAVRPDRHGGRRRARRWRWSASWSGRCRARRERLGAAHAGGGSVGSVRANRPMRCSPTTRSRSKRRRS